MDLNVENVEFRLSLAVIKMSMFSNHKGLVQQNLENLEITRSGFA